MNEEQNNALSHDKVRELGELMLEYPQVHIPMEHTLHAGVYTRTVFIPKGVLVTGVKVRKPSTMIIQGHLRITSGDGTKEFEGWNVLTLPAGRRSAGYAVEDTTVTTIIQTDATTLEEAEEQYTCEADSLQTRRRDSVRHFFSHCNRNGSRGGDDLLGSSRA